MTCGADVSGGGGGSSLFDIYSDGWMRTNASRGGTEYLDIYFMNSTGMNSTEFCLTESTVPCITTFDEVNISDGPHSNRTDADILAVAGPHSNLSNADVIAAAGPHSNTTDTDTRHDLNSTTIHNQTGEATVNETWLNSFITLLVDLTFLDALLGPHTNRTDDDILTVATVYNDTDRIDAVNDSDNLVAILGPHSNTTETDPKWGSNFTNMIVDCDTGNYSYGMHPNGTWKCRSEVDTGTVGGGTNESIFYNTTYDTYDANLSMGGVVGYEAGNYICDSNFTETHLCDWNEVRRTYDLKNVSQIVAWTGSAYVVGGPSKFTPADYFVNDGHGFTDATGADSKCNAWSFTNNKGLTGECSSALQLACCKAW
jgi:hypothetical protein